MRELDGQAASIEPRLSGAWILFALCFVALHRTIFFSASRLQIGFFFLAETAFDVMQRHYPSSSHAEP